jgi:hypothetical protein
VAGLVYIRLISNCWSSNLAFQLRIEILIPLESASTADIASKFKGSSSQGRRVLESGISWLVTNRELQIALLSCR